MRITRRLYTLQKKYAIMGQALPLGKKYQVKKGIGRTGDRLESPRLCKAETMKRIGCLFGDICKLENPYLAHVNASKGKRNRKEVQRFEADVQANIYQIQQELLQHTYTTGKYSVFIKYEPKRREIYKLPYRDRVVQWAIMQILEPIWHKCFNADTYACVKGRGIHSLLRKLRRDLYKDPDGTRYCFKMDVKKFYPSITHSVLKEVVRQKIKDPDLLWLIDDIIDSADGVPIGNVWRVSTIKRHCVENGSCIAQERAYVERNTPYACFKVRVYVSLQQREFIKKVRYERLERGRQKG